MSPPSDTWEVAEFPAKDTQSTLQTFAFDKTSAQRLISLQYEIDTIVAPLKRPTTLVEDLLRVRTNLDRVMAMDMMEMEPSPRTIVPYTTIPRQEEIVQSIETEDTTPSSAGSRRSRASAPDDLPVLKTKMNTSDIIESVEADIEAAKPQKSAEVDSIVTSADPSRKITPDVVRRKLEALGMFSQDVTSTTPGSNLPLGQSEDGVMKESLDNEKAQTEVDEEVRQKLQAVGAIAPTASAQSVTSSEEVAQDDIHMDDAHDEFLQSKLEAMGLIPRPSSPALSSSCCLCGRSSTSSMSIEDVEGEVSRIEVYDEFWQPKLEAIGVLSSRYSQSANPSTTPQDNTRQKHSSQAESNFTSPLELIVDSSEKKSEGDGAPPLSRASSRAAVSSMAAGESMDGNEYFNISSRRSSMNISAEETPSLTRESSYSAFRDEAMEIRKKSIVEIHHAQLIQPLSQVDNYVRPFLIAEEGRMVKDFLRIINDKHNQEHAGHSFIEFDLDDFMIYLPGTARHHPYEMTGLQNLSQDGHKEYLIDGTISMHGERERYIEGVMFDILSIGTYGKDNQEVSGVWIQTKLNKDSDIYYRLRKPHKYYERFHTGFMWLANLAKNFVDYAMDCEEAEKMVSIHNFRRDFYDWLIENHGNETPFRKWYAEYGNPDFRTAIASNIDWLAKEAIGSWKLEFLDVFSEVKYVDKLPFHQAKEKMTIVTPFVYECFKEMNFGRFLKKVDPNADTDFRRKSIGEALHLSTDQDVIELDSEDDNDYEKTTARLAKRSLEDFKSRLFDKSTIAVGDVLAVVKDSGDVCKWKSEKTKWSEVDECWFIYVQAIEKKHGQRALRILWMYKPADTSCALMKYPYQDELFLSAHCECNQPEWITEDQVICRVSVAWNGNHGCKEDFFVRQRFHQLEISFTTLKESDKMCGHMTFEITPMEQVQRLYTIGSTVLYQPKILDDDQRQRLEPGVIHSFNEDEGLTLHKLLRRSEADPTSNAKANELVHTDIQVHLRPDQIHHECQIRFYSSKDVAENTVPPPYSLAGACDFFYICTRLVEDLLHGGLPRYEEIHSANPPPSLIQGFDPRATQPKNPMRGLDLFCGGGNMGRGLEDGGAVRFTHACDYQDNAIASYYANTEDTEHTKFFAGSVNDLLKNAMDGNPSNISGVPLPGDIEFISAGSPCQGFSNMNPLQMNDEALRNQSLVADVASMVEFYRPKYAVLENVVAMAKKGKNDRREDCLSQLICCLVGMGYQLQVNMLDAWAFGCPQRRQRLFVVVAAPDLAMPKPPNQSHSHPSSMTNASLGLMANGLPFGQRTWTDTAFKWRSAEEATADLPDIGDGQTYHCTPFPDHRTSFNMKLLLRDQLAAIPLFPPGLNARTAWPKMSEHERSLFAVKSPATGVFTEKTAKQMENSFERVKGGQLFPTITTKCAPSEKRNGRVGHWSQQRVISIMEAKRAQGFLDTDVLVGTRSSQYKIIGNSVARPVAIGQGMALRKAWLLNEDDNPSLDAALVPITVRDDFVQLDLPPAPSSNGSDLAYMRGMKGVESYNSETGEVSSVSTAPPKRRESQFEVVIPTRKSIVEFSSSPVQQTAGYLRSLTSSFSDLPFAPAWPGVHAPVPSKAKSNAPAKNTGVQMPEVDAGEKRWQDFQELPKIRSGMAKAKRSAKQRRRMIGGVTPGLNRCASESPPPVANMSRADTSIVQASQKQAHLGHRRSQTAKPVPTISRLRTPAPAPYSRLSQKQIEQGLRGTNDRSIAQAAAQFAGLGRRRSQTSSQQKSLIATLHAEHDEDEVGPRTAKRIKLPTKPIVPGSAERPISLDDSDDEAVPIPMRMATNRARTYIPAARIPDPEAPISGAREQTPSRSSSWTAVNKPPSAETIMAQLSLVHRANYSDRPRPSPAPSRRSRAGTPHPRAKKGKKSKKPFVIDLTVDNDLPSTSVRLLREITPYQPVDNSAWMGMLFTKSMNGGLGGKDEDALLGMDFVKAESVLGDVEMVRQVEGGEAVHEEMGRPEVVYGY